MTVPRTSMRSALFFDYIFEKPIDFFYKIAYNDIEKGKCSCSLSQLRVKDELSFGQPPFFFIYEKRADVIVCSFYLLNLFSHIVDCLVRAEYDDRIARKETVLFIGQKVLSVTLNEQYV